METKVNYSIVGAFIILLLTSIVLAIIWLSSGFSFERYSTYLVYMKESVAGLSIDSTVEYNGVAVGTVKKIELNRKNPQLVAVTLNIKSSTPITQGTEATLNTKGLTGITYVALKDKGNDLRPLIILDDEPYPIIKSAPSFFLRLDTAITQITTNFQKITEALDKLLSKENQEAIHDSLANIKVFSKNLVDNNERLTEILENTRIATAQMTPLISSGQNTIRVLETQMIPSTTRLLNNLDQITRTLSEVATELRRNPSVLIRGVERRPIGPGEQ